MRGQSYDNAATMSGIYTGLQARIKAMNPLAYYVPCAGHSLNLEEHQLPAVALGLFHIPDFCKPYTTSSQPPHIDGIT
ncbi:hypothetical protein Hamer_G009519 [Homarus americanus]|uniref:DUF4371 domain-containing protein n=1 Tax=Homarus americanus TaxID=6706 RepID=A0A8J5N2V2_HOMAM|nr:hypothetical protein Hamer_G009519 [Homarus americanus]